MKRLHLFFLSVLLCLVVEGGEVVAFAEREGYEEFAGDTMLVGRYLGFIDTFENVCFKDDGNDFYSRMLREKFVGCYPKIKMTLDLHNDTRLMKLFSSCMGEGMNMAGLHVNVNLKMKGLGEGELEMCANGSAFRLMYELSLEGVKEYEEKYKDWLVGR